MFYSYQDSSYLTCILVFTQSPPLAKKKEGGDPFQLYRKKMGGEEGHTLLYFFLPSFPFFR